MSSCERYEYVKQHIHDSEMKFYCQIPFMISEQQCHVVDLRTSEEVIHQLDTFIRSVKQMSARCRDEKSALNTNNKSNKAVHSFISFIPKKTYKESNREEIETL